MSDSAFQSYLRSNQCSVHQALQKWRAGWPVHLLDFEPLPERPSLYQDRAEAYWYLAGIIMLQDVVMSSPNTYVTNAPDALSVEETLKRLMSLSDQKMLPNVEQDFDPAYRLVTGHLPGEANDRALGTLIYREADTTITGFGD